MTSLLRWNDTEDYWADFFIGSEDEGGGHIRGDAGWPYSIYRHAIACGRGDVVICHGIQNLDDAKQILDRLQCLA